MRALVQEGGTVRLIEVPAPVPRAHEVLVRVAAAGICRTDLYAAEGRLPGREPRILGHELAGTVVEVGRNVRRIERGARVTVMPLLSCAANDGRPSRDDRSPRPAAGGEAATRMSSPDDQPGPAKRGAGESSGEAAARFASADDRHGPAKRGVGASSGDAAARFASADDRHGHAKRGAGASSGEAAARFASADDRHGPAKRGAGTSSGEAAAQIPSADDRPGQATLPASELSGEAGSWMRSAGAEPGCPACFADPPGRCASPRMLGVDVHGAFAELLAVPEACLHVLPDHLDFRHGAYVEPIAASLAPINAGLDPRRRGVIYGRNRIAELTLRILRAHGFSSLTIHDPARELARASLDFAIETLATADSLRALFDALRPGGTLVLKSRPPQPVAIDLAQAVKKDLRLIAVGYAPFPSAIALLSERRIEIDDLLGREYPLAQWAEAFAAARADESAKLFLVP